MLSLLKKNLLLGCVFLALNLVDFLTTVYLIKHGAYEGNPFMRIFTLLGFRQFVAVKGSLSILITLGLLFKKDRESAYRIFVGVSCGFGVITFYQIMACVSAFL